MVCGKLVPFFYGTMLPNFSILLVIYFFIILVVYNFLQLVHSHSSQIYFFKLSIFCLLSPLFRFSQRCQCFIIFNMLFKNSINECHYVVASATDVYCLLKVELHNAIGNTVPTRKLKRIKESVTERSKVASS